MKLSVAQVVGAAIIIPIVSLVVVALSKRLWRWFAKAIDRSFGDTVRNAMADDMAKMATADDLAHLSTKVASSIDELRQSNTADHRRVQNRLAEFENAVTAQFAAADGRLEAIEERLPRLERRRPVNPSEED